MKVYNNEENKKYNVEQRQKFSPKEILRQKAKKHKSLREVGLNIPGVGSYNLNKFISIAYKNRKKEKERKKLKN